MSTTPGRNQPCPCGSGKKFKRCHGGLDAGYEEMISRGAEHAQRQAEIHKLQRERQQGLGRGIISTDLNGTRLVVVGYRKCWGHWKTFHDFLFWYVMDVLTKEWFRTEDRKDPSGWHPIFDWSRRCLALLTPDPSQAGQVKHTPITGAVNAYLTLGNDLYALEHNINQTTTPAIRERLLARLKHPDQFIGARYEIRIAAMFLRAGFDLTWEDETDITSDHGEFTATYPKTGKSFWIECKMRNQSPESKPLAGFGKFVGLVSDALRKEAELERLIFVDLNTPAKPRVEGSFHDWRTAAVSNLRKFEGSPNAIELPRALIFITNFPDHHHLDDFVPDAGAILEGFKTAEYRTGIPTTVRRKLEQREKHPEVEAFFASMVEHNEVPPTFDGEIPGLDSGHRLLIGHRYQMDDGFIGELDEACVDEGSGNAMLIVRMDDGRRLVYENQLSDLEFAAWRRYPETFFGVFRQGKTKMEDPTELYDMMMSVYANTEKEKLLDFIAPEPGANRDLLGTLSQPELVRMYAENSTNSILITAGPPVPTIMQRMRKPPDTKNE